MEPVAAVNISSSPSPGSPHAANLNAGLAEKEMIKHRNCKACCGRCSEKNTEKRNPEMENRIKTAIPSDGSC
jgi:hypothetical protein